MNNFTNNLVFGNWVQECERAHPMKKKEGAKWIDIVRWNKRCRHASLWEGNHNMKAKWCIIKEDFEVAYLT